MAKNKYTIPMSEISYTKEYPPILEFNRLKEYIRINQGGGEISLNGKPLESEGFSKCVGLILQNNNNLESSLFHIDDLDLKCEYHHHQTRVVECLIKNYLRDLNLGDKARERLFSALYDVCRYNYPKAMERDEFQESMKELNKDGIIQARFVGGTISRIWIKDRIIKSLLGFLGISVKDDILVDTGNYHWDMLYRPYKETVYVNSKKQKKVLTFKF